MSTAINADIVLGHALDDHLNTATDLAHALLMIACSEIFGGDDAVRRTVSTLAGDILDHQKAIHAAWDAWIRAGRLRAAYGEGGRA